MPQAREALGDIAPALAALEGVERHLAAHSVQTGKPVLTLGPWVGVDAGLSDVAAVHGGNPARLAEAKYHLKGTPCPPYFLPEQP